MGEFHYITHTDNLESIARRGLLSHQRAGRIPHTSVAMVEVQDIRAGKRVPGGRPLHEYVNLYFHCRNSMMFVKMRNGEKDLAVVRVSPQVMDIDGAVITDGNAACLATRFMPSPGGIANLQADRVFAVSWNSPDPITKAERKRQRCAELLVPDKVDPQYIIGYYIHSESQRLTCERQVFGAPVEVSKDEFFE